MNWFHAYNVAAAFDSTLPPLPQGESVCCYVLQIIKGGVLLEEERANMHAC